MGVDRLHAHGVQIIDGSAQPDGRDDRRRAGLELGGQIGRSKAVQRDVADHAPAAQERRHGLQQLPFSEQHADPRRPEHLVPAEGQEITVQRLHVGHQVRHALGAVDQHQGARLVGAANDFLDRVDRAQHVRDGRDRHDSGPLGQQLVQLV